MSALKKKIVALRLKVGQLYYNSDVSNLNADEKYQVQHNLNIARDALNKASNSIY
jgi:hypothetical protein